LPPFLRYIIVEVVADLKVVYSSSTFTTEAQLRKFADSCPEPPIEPETIGRFLADIKGPPETRHATTVL